jgi:hypothetical protein
LELSKEARLLTAALLLLAHGAVTPEVWATPQTPTAQVWLAKKRRRGKKLPSLVVKTSLPTVNLKLKRRRATGVLVEPGGELTVAFSGAGRLGILVYQALGARQKKGSAPVTVLWNVDGGARRRISFTGSIDRQARVSGPASKALSQPRGATARVGDGGHRASFEVPAGTTAAVIELRWYPGKAKNPASVRMVTVAASELGPPPASPQPLPPPGAPATPRESPAVQVAAGARPTTAKEIEKQIAAGGIRDGVVGAYTMIAIRNVNDGSSGWFARASADRPYAFVVDGPGDVTVRVHRLASGSEVLPRSETLTILENDVLLKTLDLDLPISDSLEVVGATSLATSAIQEYKLGLGPRVSRFTFQPSEASASGIAIQYSFEPEDKNSAMALTMDLGDDLGLGDELGGTTNITQVAVREKLVQVVTEKVVRVGDARSEILGVAVTAGSSIPTWGGAPVPAAGLELQWVLPFGDGAWALSAEGSAQWHTLSSRGVDSTQAELHSRAEVWLVPVRAGPTFRYSFSDSIRLAVGARGSFNYLFGTSHSLGGDTGASTTALGAAGSVSFEVRVGAGWWALDAGYAWAQTVDLGRAVRAFNPAGVEVGMRFRFVL